MVEYHPISSRDQPRLHQFGKKVLLGIFLGHVLIVENSERTHHHCGHWGDGKPGLGRNPSSEAECNRSVNATKRVKLLDSQPQMEQLNCLEETTVREPTLRRKQLVRSEDLRQELQGISERSQPTEAKDDAEDRKDFRSIEGDFIYRHHIEPRVQLFVPKEETFPIPLKHVDVTRATWTNLDVLQESRIDDYWNVDVDRSLSDSRTGFTKSTFFLWKEKLPSGYMWFREPRTKIQTTARPDYLWPEIWSGMSNAAQKNEKEEWAMEKPKLDNARKLRGVFFWKARGRQRSKTERHLFHRSARWRDREAIKNARKKLEIVMEAAMLCKTGTKKCLKKLRETVSESDESNTIQNTKHAWIVEAHGSTPPKDHEDHIAGKGYKSISHYILVHKFLPMPQAMKIPDAKAAAHKEWKKLETMPTSLASGRDEEQQGCYCGSTKREEIGPLCYIRDSVRLQTVLLCMNKKMFETTNNRAIPEWRHQWHDILISWLGHGTSKLGTKGLEQEQWPRDKNGQKSALRGNWENALSEMHKDSVHEETLAFSAKEVIVDRKYIRALLLQLRSHRLTEENPRKVLFWSQRRKPFQKKRPKAVQTFPQMKVYGPVVWLLAPSGMSKVQVWDWMHLWQ